MHLARFPRRRYTEEWTPLEKMERLSRLLGGPDLYIKRDDLLGLAGGGNKTRKLEFLVADALAKGADTLITCRRRPVEPLPADARRRGEGRAEVPARARGARGQAATTPRPPATTSCSSCSVSRRSHVVKTGVDLAAEMHKVADDVAALGRTAYVIPGGGSNPTRRPWLRVLRRGDPGADLRAGPSHRPHRVRQREHRHARGPADPGLVGNNSHIPLTGINVRRTREEQEPNVHRLAQEVAALLCDRWRECRARPSARWATGWGRATRCRRPRWSKRCAWSPGSRGSCSIPSTPARRWPG